MVNRHAVDRPTDAIIGPILVADRQALADLVKDAVEHDHGGNLSEAARAIRGKVKGLTLSQPTLQRLSKGGQRSITEATLYGLIVLVGNANRDRLHDCLLSESASQRLADYESLYEGLRLDADEDRKKDKIALIRLMRRRYPAEFVTFDRLVEKTEHSAVSVNLALDRMVAPFVLAFEGGEIERRWSELSDEERRIYVKSAIKRECVLLSRPADLRRAQTGSGLYKWFRKRPSKTLADALSELP
jgi:hypothetical protein